MSRRSHPSHRVVWWRPLGRQFALPLVVAAAALLASGGCWPRPKWRRTDEFVGQLRCGMTSAEIEALGRRYPALQLHQREFAKEGCPLAADKGNTTICMDFDESGLRSAQVSWVDTIMHLQVLPVLDLCRDSGASAPTPPPGPTTTTPP